MKFDSKTVQVGHEPDDRFGDVVPPLHIATTYEQRNQDPQRYFYARGENPTREGLERCLSSIEDAAFASVYSSGQAAGATALSLLSPGQRVIASDDIYGGTYLLFSLQERYGIRVDYVDLSQPEAFEAAMSDDVAMVWIETPTNPLLKVADIEAIAERAHQAGALVLVDNTFASPALQLPLELGADISLYSTTKFIAGHSDVIGGSLVYNDEELHRKFVSYRTATGNIPSPMDCFLVQRGLKTLSLRMERQVRNSVRIAEMLNASDRVGSVHYPGIPSHPQHELVQRQMSGPGAIVTFEYLGDAEKVLERTQMFACAVSLGSVRSLIECPATMTHRPIPVETRRKLGISDNLIRLAVGIEDPEDLLNDLQAALENA